MERKKITSKDMEAMRQRDSEKVKGKFIFHEVPGGIMDFTIKLYKGDAPQNYSLRDGEIYELPLGVARHLNTNCFYPVHTYAQDEFGKPMAKIGQKVRRCSFQSLDFMEIENMHSSKEIITVERI